MYWWMWTARGTLGDFLGASPRRPLLHHPAYLGALPELQFRWGHCFLGSAWPHWFSRQEGNLLESLFSIRAGERGGGLEHSLRGADSTSPQMPAHHRTRGKAYRYHTRFQQLLLDDIGWFGLLPPHWLWGPLGKGVSFPFSAGTAPFFPSSGPSRGLRGKLLYIFRVTGRSLRVRGCCVRGAWITVSWDFLGDRSLLGLSGRRLLYHWKAPERCHAGELIRQLLLWHNGLGDDRRSMMARCRSLPPRTSRSSRWAGCGFRI